MRLLASDGRWWFRLPEPGGRGGSPAGGGALGGSAGSGGTGTGGSSPLALCQDGVTPFGVCFVNDADVLPLPPASQDPGVEAMGDATVQDVGVGPAPASCESARVFGTRGTSEWWFEAKATDGHSWTIGMRGLGRVPLVKKGDRVTLDLYWLGHAGTDGPPVGVVQLADASAKPLLWAGTTNAGFMTPWMYLHGGDPVCAFRADSCDASRLEVVGAIDGNPVRIQPYSTAYVGPYFVAVGQPVRIILGDVRCEGYLGRGFDAAITRVSSAITSPSP